MSALPMDVLERVETRFGIRLVRDGEGLRILARRGSDSATATEQVRDLKPILHEATLQREIIALASAPAELFDRARFEALYAEWEQRYRVPREAQEGGSCLE